MPMNLPALATITLPPRAKTVVALELINNLFTSLRSRANRPAVRLPNFEEGDVSQQVNEVMGRINRMVTDAELDESARRLDQLDGSLAQVLRQIEREFQSSNEYSETAWESFAAIVENGGNPFALRQMLLEIDTAMSDQLAAAQVRRDDFVLEANTGFNRYEVARNRAQQIDSLRDSVQTGPSDATKESPVHFYILRLTMAAIIALVAGYMLVRFIGGGWVIFLGSSIAVLTVMSLYFLRKRGESLDREEVPDMQHIFPTEFKEAVTNYATTRLAQFAAERTARRLERLQQAWADRAMQGEFAGINDKLEEVSVQVERALEDAPTGFFNEFLPGDILLYGRALGQLLATNLENRIGQQRVEQQLTAHLLAVNSEWPQLLRERSAAEILTELTRAADIVIGKLQFSTVLDEVWRDPQGAASAEFWLDRLRSEVMAAASFREGFSRIESDVQEILSCGLPDGVTDSLASEMMKKFGGEIHQSTVSDGLELVCVARNVRLDDLLSTPRLRASYEDFDPKVRNIYFNFQSRATVASGVKLGADKKTDSAVKNSRTATEQEVGEGEKTGTM